MRAVCVLLLVLCLTPDIAQSAQRMKVALPPLRPLTADCVLDANAHAAAWLLRKEYRRTGNLWQAIGAYHSRTPHRRDAYIRRVKSNLERLRKEGLSVLALRSGEIRP